jgi:hypothetical protein
VLRSCRHVAANLNRLAEKRSVWVAPVERAIIAARRNAGASASRRNEPRRQVGGGSRRPSPEVVRRHRSNSRA